MPGYAWTCHVCGASVAAGQEVCSACQAPAVLSANAIEDLRRKRAGLAPQPRSRRWDPRRTGWVFLGAYLCVVAMFVLFVFLSSGDMAGLVLVVPALPWPFLAGVLFGSAGFGIGVLGGLVLNAVVAFYAGMLAARLKNA